MRTRTLIVKKIEREADRALLFGNDERYHVISEKNEDVNVGDKIEYEPYGVNFGWYIKKVV